MSEKDLYTLDVLITHPDPNVILRDADGMPFLNTDHIKGVHAYAFLAALNGSAASSRPSQCEFDLHWQGAPTIHCSAEPFQGTSTVMKELQNSLQGQEELCKALLPMEEAEAAFLKKSPVIQSLSQGEPIRYPYLHDRIDIFLFDELRKREGNQNLIEAWNALHPLPNESHICGKNDNIRALVKDASIDEIHAAIHSKAPYIWLDDEGILQKGDARKAAMTVPIQPVRDALYGQTLPKNLAIMENCEKEISDEATLQKAFAHLVQKSLKGSMIKKFHGAAMYLGTYGIDALRKDALQYAESPEDLVTMEEPVKKVVMHSEISKNFSSLAAKKLQTYWKNHPDDIQTSVRQLLSKDSSQRALAMQTIEAAEKQESMSR